MLMNWSTIEIQWHQNAKAISQRDCDLNPDEPLETHRSMIDAHTAVSTWLTSDQRRVFGHRIMLG